MAPPFSKYGNVTLVPPYQRYITVVMLMLAAPLTSAAGWDAELSVSELPGFMAVKLFHVKSADSSHGYLQQPGPLQLRWDGVQREAT